MTIEIENCHFELHTSGATFWKDQNILLISDVHLGKISHFRKFGSAVPQKAIAKNFSELTKLVEHFSPAKIAFLGDLFHSSLNAEWDLFEEWVNSVTSEIILITGNHDIISPLKYEELNIKIQPMLKIGNFRLTHHPEATTADFNICGHIHPGFKLTGKGRQQLKLRCFYKSQNQLILPAFGEFTGNHYLKPKEEDQIFAITENEVILVN
jgi:DNA ligase-associated metallophosphoesterase